MHSSGEDSLIPATAAAFAVTHDRYTLPLRLILVHNLAPAVAVVTGGTDASFSMALLAKHPNLLPDRLHLFPVRRRDPLCHPDPLRRFTVRIRYFVGEHLCVDESRPVAAVTSFFAGSTAGIILKSVRCEDMDNPGFYIRSEFAQRGYFIAPGYCVFGQQLDRPFPIIVTDTIFRGRRYTPLRRVPASYPLPP
nr:Uncharacterised protein [Raoultella sp. NCTC 9187]